MNQWVNEWINKYVTTFSREMKLQSQNRWDESLGVLRVNAAQEMMNYNVHSAHTVKTSITCLRKMKISKTMSGAPCCDKLRWEDPLRERGWGQLEQHLETKLTQKQNQQTRTRKTHFLAPLHSLHRKEIRKWKETVWGQVEDKAGKEQEAGTQETSI